MFVNGYNLRYKTAKRKKRQSKYRFSSSIPGMPGEAKNFNSIFCVGGGPYYIYIYIHVVMSWDVLSVGGSPQLIDNCVIV